MSDGYFPAGSMLRHVQSHRAVGQTYGQRALIVGATNPVPYVGTSASTLAKERPFERLARTALAFETVYFGTKAEADRLLAAVHSMHTQVQGTLDRDEESFPAGTPYDAFEAWMRAWYDSGRMHLTDEARGVGRAIATDMPVPLFMTPGIRLTNLCVVGMLPRQVRRLYGLRWTAAHQAAWRTTTTAVRRSQRLVPDTIRLGDNADLHRLVIRKERALVASGRQTMDFTAA